MLSACATTDDVVVGRNNNPIDAPIDVVEMLKTAQMQRQARDYEAAVRTLGQLVLALPDDPRVLTEYGKVLLDKGETSDALAFLQRSVELQPDWSAYSAQGVAYAQSGDYAHAEVAFTRALSMKPGDPTVLNNFALAQLQAGKLDAAETLLRQAEAAGLDHPRVAQNLALVRRLRAGRTQPSPQAMPAPQSVSGPVAAVPVAPARPAAAPLAPVPALQPVPPTEARVAVAPPPAIVKAELPPPVAPQPPPAPAAQVANVTVVTPRPAAVPAPQPPIPRVANGTPAQLTAAPPSPPRVRVPPGGALYVQVAASSSEEGAQNVVSKLKALGAMTTPVDRNGTIFHRVRIGPFADYDKAASALARAQELGYPDAFILPEGPAAATPGPAPAVPPKTAQAGGTPNLRLSENGGAQE